MSHSCQGLATAVLDLFCGAAGGWSLGMHRAGFHTVAACEIEAQRRAAFVRNNPGVVIYDDVRTLNAARLRADLGYLPDIIVGSPPCQDASAANHRGRGIEGERTGLFKEYVRIVGEVRPRWCAAENSPRLRTRGADWILDALAAIGYTCWPLVVGAIHAGAPHERHRVWFIAADTDRLGSRPRQRRQDTPRRPYVARASADDLDADRIAEPDVPIDGEVAGQLGLSAGHSDGEGLAFGQSIGSHASAQLAALERAVGPLGMQWNRGPARHFGMAHGVPGGLARDCIAAYGDAVIPRITEAIGNAIRRTDEHLIDLARRVRMPQEVTA